MNGGLTVGRKWNNISESDSTSGRIANAGTPKEQSRRLFQAKMRLDMTLRESEQKQLIHRKCRRQENGRFKKDALNEEQNLKEDRK